MPERPQHAYLSLGQMTQGSGCTPRAIRHYEQLGLIVAKRSSGGHRLFAPEALERLRLIVGLREAGCSLEEIGELFRQQTSSANAEACGQLGEVLAGHISRLETKLGLLRGLFQDLQSTRQLLAICETCTDPERPQSCACCERVPQADQRPSGFRLLCTQPGPANPDRSS